MDKPTKKETMLEAFLRQTKIDDAAADERDRNGNKVDEMNLKRALKEWYSMPDMRESLNIPTKLPKEQIPPTLPTPTKPGDKGYLEANRWPLIGGEYDPVEMDKG